MLTPTRQTVEADVTAKENQHRQHFGSSRVGERTSNRSRGKQCISSGWMCIQRSSLLCKFGHHVHMDISLWDVAVHWKFPWGIVGSSEIDGCWSLNFELCNFQSWEIRAVLRLVVVPIHLHWADLISWGAQFLLLKPLTSTWAADKRSPGFPEPPG